MFLTVFVVDDDEAARESLVALLRVEGFAARAFASGSDFLAQLSPEHHGCVVTDIRMPGMDGIALAHRLTELGCNIPVIVVTGHADVGLAVQAMKAGVKDFIEKPFRGADILAAVRQAMDITLDSYAKDVELQGIRSMLATLTGREAQVFKGLAAGRSNKELATSLAISHRTVETYRSNVMDKMQAKSLSDLVRMNLLADSHGLTSATSVP